MHFNCEKALNLLLVGKWTVGSVWGKTKQISQCTCEQPLGECCGEVCTCHLCYVPNFFSSLLISTPIWSNILLFIFFKHLCPTFIAFCILKHVNFIALCYFNIALNILHIGCLTAHHACCSQLHFRKQQLF